MSRRRSSKTTSPRIDAVREKQHEHVVGDDRGIVALPTGSPFVVVFGVKVGTAWSYGVFPHV